MASLRRESIEWCDVWIRSADLDRPQRALFIGDSITRGYYQAAETRLGDAAACARLATSRFASDPVYHQELALVLGQYRFTAIHFNNGLHGWDFTEDEYRDGLRLLIDQLRRLAPKAALVWGSSTPIYQAGDLTRFDPRHQRVMERNRIAGALMAEHRIPVDDLFGAALGQTTWFAGDGIHYNSEGCARLGEQAAASVAPLVTGR